MGILRQLVVCAFVVLVAASSASSPPPASAIRGDESVVIVPPAPANGSGGESLSRWSARRRFDVGVILEFENWNGSVNLVLDGDYDRCAAASRSQRIADGNTTTRVRLDAPGVFYFVGGSPARCQAGERMVVKVQATPAKSSGGEAPDQRPTSDVRDWNKWERYTRSAVTISDSGPGGSLLASPSPASPPEQVGSFGSDKSNDESSWRVGIVIVSMLGGLGILLLALIFYIDFREAKVRAVKMKAITTAKYEYVHCDYKEGGSKECVICLEEYEDQVSLGVLPCNHRFHDACIRQWLRVGVEAYCPICKVPV